MDLATLIPKVFGGQKLSKYRAHKINNQRHLWRCKGQDAVQRITVQKASVKGVFWLLGAYWTRCRAGCPAGSGMLGAERCMVFLNYI